MYVQQHFSFLSLPFRAFRRSVRFSLDYMQWMALFLHTIIPVLVFRILITMHSLLRSKGVGGSNDFTPYYEQYLMHAICRAHVSHQFALGYVLASKKWTVCVCSPRRPIASQRRERRTFHPCAQCECRESQGELSRWRVRVPLRASGEDELFRARAPCDIFKVWQLATHTPD